MTTITTHPKADIKPSWQIKLEHIYCDMLIDQANEMSKQRGAPATDVVLATIRGMETVPDSVLKVTRPVIPEQFREALTADWAMEIWRDAGIRALFSLDPETATNAAWKA